jgi:hypothetical protein
MESSTLNLIRLPLFNIIHENPSGQVPCSSAGTEMRVLGKGQGAAVPSETAHVGMAVFFTLFTDAPLELLDVAEGSASLSKSYCEDFAKTSLPPPGVLIIWLMVTARVEKRRVPNITERTTNIHEPDP